MIDFDKTRLALFNWVNDNLPSKYNVIWLNPNAPRPELPYIALQITEYESIAQDYLAHPDEDGEAVIYGDREFLLELNHYGDGGLASMEALQTSLHDWNVQQKLLEDGVFFVDRLNQIQADELLDSKWEQRFILELRFRVSNQGVEKASTVNVGLIESVEMTVEAQDDAGDVVRKQEFTVEK